MQLLLIQHRSNSGRFLFFTPFRTTHFNIARTGHSASGTGRQTSSGTDGSSVASIDGLIPTHTASILADIVDVAVHGGI